MSAEDTEIGDPARVEPPGLLFGLGRVTSSAMFSHVMVGARDVDRLAAFYDAVLIPLGLVRAEWSDGPKGASWRRPDARHPTFDVQEPVNGLPASVGNGAMVAFLAPSRDAVDQAHRHPSSPASSKESTSPPPAAVSRALRLRQPSSVVSAAGRSSSRARIGFRFWSLQERSTSVDDPGVHPFVSMISASSVSASLPKGTSIVGSDVRGWTASSPPT